MGTVTGQQNGTELSSARRGSIASVVPTDGINNAGLVVASALNDTLVATTTTYIYVGTATLGTATSEPLWQIQRVNKIANPLTVGYACNIEDAVKINKGAFMFVWDDRASLDYTR